MDSNFLAVSWLARLLVGFALLACSPALAGGPEDSWDFLKKTPMLGLNSAAKKQSPVDFSQSKKVKVLVYWASWCPYCKKLLYKSDHYMKGSQFRNQVSFLGIGIEKDTKKAHDFAQKEQLQIPLWYDKSRKLKDQLNIPVLPLTVLLGQKNEVLAVYSGLEDETFNNINQRIYRYMTYELADKTN